MRFPRGVDQPPISSEEKNRKGWEGTVSFVRVLPDRCCPVDFAAALFSCAGAAGAGRSVPFAGAGGATVSIDRAYRETVPRSQNATNNLFIFNYLRYNNDIRTYIIIYIPHSRIFLMTKLPQTTMFRSLGTSLLFDTTKQKRQKLFDTVKWFGRAGRWYPEGF